MTESVTTGDRDTVVASIIEALSAPYHIVNSKAETIAALPNTELAHAAAESTLVAEPDALKTVRDDFKTATALADLVEDGLSLVEQPTDPEGSAIIGEDGYALLIAADNTVTAVHATDGTSELQDFASSQADTGTAFSLRTAGRQRIRETARDTFGDAFVEEFDAAVAGVDSFPDNVGSVVLTLALAARHEELLYDVSKWGEDIGLASKATYSRTKTNLEDLGLIDTEKVPIDVGRPRLRLLAGSDDLANVGADELVEYLDTAVTE